jgi:pilus assembly protein FimV
MSNEDLPQSAELASAYLDGELDGPQRAAAAGDPNVMAAVDSLARVRAALGDVPIADPTSKDTAIAAALAEFDAMRSTSTAAATATAPAAVVSLQSRRHRAYRVISGAAAAAIVAVVAVAALNSNRGSDDSTSSATEVPAIAAADTAPELKAVAADAGATMEAAPEASESDSVGGQDDTASVPAIGTPEALTQYAESMETASITAAPAGTTAPAATVAAAAPSAQDAGSAGYAAVACLSSDQVVIGSIIYKGTPALAVHNYGTDTLQAIADSDCRVLDEVAAP